MSWDGIYHAKNHHGVRVETPGLGSRVVITCKRRGVKRWTSDEKRVSCFACLKIMGVIK